MRRGRGWAVVTVLSMLALAGCTGSSEDPPTTPSPTSPAASPSETPSPTPTPDAATPPERPDMSQVDAATAEAIARYFLELYPYVYATGDLTEWKALSHPECIFCASVITNVEEMVAAGEHWEGGLTTIDSTEVAAELAEAFNVTATTTESRSHRVDRDGTTLQSSIGGSSTMHLVLTTDAGQWLVRGVEVD